MNCDLKEGLSAKPVPKCVEKLEKSLENHMQMLVQNPEKVQKYFNHKGIKYAT